MRGRGVRGRGVRGRGCEDIDTALIKKPNSQDMMTYKEEYCHYLNKLTQILEATGLTSFDTYP